jgi:DNA polymerase-3 subunit beta
MTTEKTPIRAKFQARFLPMLDPFMGVQDIRYYLNGFLIERAKQGVVLVATNGHVLAAIKDAEGMLEGADQVIVRRDVPLIRACKGRFTQPPYVLIANGRVTIAPDFGLEGTDAETFVMPGKPFLEAKYPNWKRVVPDFKKLKPGIRSACADADYMALFAKLKKYGGTKTLRFWQSEDVRPDGEGEGSSGAGIVVQHASVPEFLGVVMPMRDTEKWRDEAMASLKNITA